MLMVLAILGVLSTVVTSKIGGLYGTGAVESYGAEPHSIQTSVIAMLVDSGSGTLAPLITPAADMDTAQTTDPTPLLLSDYLAGLTADGTVRSGCRYTFTADGAVMQTTP